MRQQYAAFQTAGVEIVVVGMGTPVQTREFIAAEQLPFPVLSDPRRLSHRAYGVMRGNLRQVMLSPRIWKQGMSAAAAGYKPSQTIGDGMQLSGTFIIDQDGIIRFADRADLSSDYTSADTLLAAIARLPQQSAPAEVS